MSTYGNPPSRPDLPKIYDYFATTVGGLEHVVAGDLQRLLPHLQQLRVERGERHGRLFFHYERSPRQLLELRCVDNLFALLAHIPEVTTGGPGLQRIVDQVAHTDLRPALALHDALNGPRDEPVGRLICTVSGRHRFTAADLQNALRAPFSAQLPMADAPPERTCTFHLQVVGKKALLGLQLTPRRLRDRQYRKADIPGGLEATVAYCMALLAGVGERQICLDPMCGSGTTLIEAALAFRPARLIGGDIDPPVLAAARQNARTASVPVSLLHWDATHLPLAAASVDALLCNLPYGKKVARIQRGPQNPFLQEFARVLRPGGKAALLTTGSVAMDIYLEDPDFPFTRQQRLPLHLRGVDPALYVLERKS